ncbi:competence/damage-inducible protein A [Agrilactobacillus fermenti]|uniref:competence/damage-inducible protein A n=1 Tax=Agrilactobacillus fermenti TaxID=2586909 RepID=UPI001E428D31|nr:competence/damage-inducible protein A [Agrilactobacillus fermenti]MCD2257205.1 competence/damage-inducible protein A [Agrilactobacillus fermenti]
MQAEIIAVGTELLLGQINDTNGQFLARTLADIGIDTYFQTVVGDNPARLKSVLKLAFSRSDLIITIGGLGPTEDDLTKQTVAEFIDRPLVPDQTAMTNLLRFYEQSHRELTENNKIQAYYPEGAQVLPNDDGLAVGSVTTIDDKTIIMLPGPPSEFQPMVLNHLREILIKLSHKDHVLVSRVLRFFGIGESQIATKLADLIDTQSNPTLATYAKDYETTLRLTAKAKNSGDAKRYLDELEAKVQQRIGAYFYGYGDNNNLQQVVVKELIRRDLSITAAESLTGGLFQSMIAEVPASSQVFAGGFVTYALEEKAKMLGIDAAILHEHGVVSEMTAKLMAEKSRQQVGSQIGVGFTGVAGPDELEGQKVGTVYIGLSFADQPTQVKLFHFPRQRNDIRVSAAMAGFFMIYQQLKK